MLNYQSHQVCFSQEWYKILATGYTHTQLLFQRKVIFFCFNQMVITKLKSNYYGTLIFSWTDLVIPGTAPTLVAMPNNRFYQKYYVMTDLKVN